MEDIIKAALTAKPTNNGEVDYKNKREENRIDQRNISIKREISPRVVSEMGDALNSVEKKPRLLTRRGDSRSEKTPTLLAIGDREINIFVKERRHLKDYYNLDIIMDSELGRCIDDCPPILRTKMSPDVSFVMIWALTPLAWKLRRISHPGQREISVFEPNKNFTIAHIPTLMEEMVEIAQNKNPNCNVYLVIPSIKDYNFFNHKRIRKKWGYQYVNYLKSDPTMNPIDMRKHSVYAFDTFESLCFDRYVWPNKFCLRGNHVMNHFYNNNRRSLLDDTPAPHVLYMKKNQIMLKSPLLENGIHANRGFLNTFMKIFSEYFKFPSGVTPLIGQLNTQEPRRDTEDVFTETTRIVESNLSATDHEGNPELVPVREAEEYIEYIQPSTSSASVPMEQRLGRSSISLRTPSSFVPTPIRHSNVQPSHQQIDPERRKINASVVRSGIRDVVEIIGVASMDIVERREFFQQFREILDDEEVVTNLGSTRLLHRQ